MAVALYSLFHQSHTTTIMRERLNDYHCPHAFGSWADRNTPKETESRINDDCKLLSNIAWMFFKKLWFDQQKHEITYTLCFIVAYIKPFQHLSHSVTHTNENIWSRFSRRPIGAEWAHSRFSSANDKGKTNCLREQSWVMYRELLTELISSHSITIGLLLHWSRFRS